MTALLTTQAAEDLERLSIFVMRKSNSPYTSIFVLLYE